MPSYFVMQPNGKLAVFSTVVDHFTKVNLTKSDAKRWCQSKGMTVKEATEKIKRGAEDSISEVMTKPCCDDVPLRRWHHALDTILHIHGTAELAKFLAENPETYIAPPADGTPR